MKESKPMNAERIKNRFWDNHAEIKNWREIVQDGEMVYDMMGRPTNGKIELEVAQRVQFRYAKRLLAKMTDEQLTETFGTKWVGFVKRWIGAEWVTTTRGTEYAKLAD
jgi:hypothetical protein